MLCVTRDLTEPISTNQQRGFNRTSVFKLYYYIFFWDDILFSESWNVVLLDFGAVSDTEIDEAPHDLGDCLHCDVVLHDIVEGPVHVVDVVLAAEGDARPAAAVPDPHPP